MNYSFNIIELDAEAMQAPKQEEESDADYAARLRAAKGKDFFRIVVQDGEQKQFGMESPFFDRTSEQQKWNMLDAGLKSVKKAIVARERIKANEPKEEKSSIIAATEGDFRRLRNGRN